MFKMQRTEQGKSLRKAYESHEIKHGFNEFREPVARTDGMTNTISTVQKDNLLVERNGGGQRQLPIDLTLNEPRAIDRANCIKARYDAGISNFKQDGTGVVERTGNKI